MARWRDERKTEALEIVERVVERVDFQFAAVAGAGVDLAYRKAAAETTARGGIDAPGKLIERFVVGLRRRFGQCSMGNALE